MLKPLSNSFNLVFLRKIEWLALRFLGKGQPDSEKVRIEQNMVHPREALVKETPTAFPPRLVNAASPSIGPFALRESLLGVANVDS
jgi:hypothetical protein